jgi:hypothetical protein
VLAQPLVEALDLEGESVSSEDERFITWRIDLKV